MENEIQPLPDSIEEWENELFKMKKKDIVNNFISVTLLYEGFIRKEQEISKNTKDQVEALRYYKIVHSAVQSELFDRLTLLDALLEGKHNSHDKHIRIVRVVTELIRDVYHTMAEVHEQ